MNTKKIVISSLCVFIFVFFYEAVLHGFLLKDLYFKTASLWRSPEEMKNFFPFVTVIQIIFSLLIVLFYKFTVKEYNLKSGLIFGAFLGLLFGVSQFGLYAYMPIPLSLALAWFAGIFIESLIVGGIMGFLSRD